MPETEVGASNHESSDLDADYIVAARNGDHGAYAHLVRRYSADAVRVATAVVGPGADAEDATQTAFVKAFANLPKFRDGAAFRPWLLRIVANEAKNRRRSAARRDTLAERYAQEPPPPAVGPEESALRRADDHLVMAALAALRTSDRTVIAYRYFADMSEAEMAEALGVRAGTVKSRLSRAMDRLRAQIDQGARK